MLDRKRFKLPCVDHTLFLVLRGANDFLLKAAPVYSFLLHLMLEQDADRVLASSLLSCWMLWLREWMLLSDCSTAD